MNLALKTSKNNVVYKRSWNPTPVGDITELKAIERALE